MSTLDEAGFVLGLLLAIWLVLAGIAIVRGLSMQRRAAISAAQSGRLAALIDAAPVLPVIVREDMRIEFPDRLSQWLGLHGTPRFLDDLSPGGGERASGMTREDIAALKNHVADVRRSAGRFSLSLGVEGSRRVLHISGALAPSVIGGQGAVVLWFADVTEGCSEQITIEAERDRAVAAF